MAEHPADEPDERRRLLVRRGLLVAIAILYVASVPWYRAVDAPLRLWLGLPDWVAVALLCYTAAAGLNAIAWAFTRVDDTDDVDGGGAS